MPMDTVMLSEGFESSRAHQIQEIEGLSPEPRQAFLLCAAASRTSEALHEVLHHSSGRRRNYYLRRCRVRVIGGRVECARDQRALTARYCNIPIVFNTITFTAGRRIQSLPNAGNLHLARFLVTMRFAGF